MRTRIVHAVAGIFVLTSVLLAIFVHTYWLGLAAFVGLNLFQSAITKFCPLEFFLEKAGIKE